MSPAFGKPCSTNRNWTIIQFYCAALCVLLVTKGSHSAECYVSVTRCPCSMDLWNERAQNVSCVQPRNYACVLHESNILVQICTTNFTILNGTPGCPYVKRCKGKEAEFGISSKYKECPENIEGCPTKNHSEYSIYQLHRYPACFITNRTELKNGTFRNYCIKKQPVGTNPKPSKRGSNLFWKIFGPILAILVLAGFGITIYVIIRRQKTAESFKDKEDYTPLYEKTVRGEDFEGLKKKLLMINKREVENCKKLYPGMRSFNKSNDLSYFAPVILKDDIDYINNGIHLDHDDSARIEPKDIKTPEDIFEKDDLRFIFLRGHAGSGKTTFCMRLLDYWYKAHSNSDYVIDSEEKPWVDYLRKFKYLFLISLKEAKDTALVTEMILHDLNFVLENDFNDEIEKVIYSKCYKCLIILEGLNNWKPSDKVLSLLRINGFPNIDPMPNTTVLISSRPCKLDEISGIIRTNDRMINILGLEKRGVIRVFENILVHFYDKKSLDLNEQYGKFKLIFPESFVSNPLLLYSAVHVWYKQANSPTVQSKTDLFLSLVTFLIDDVYHNVASVDRNLQGMEMSSEIREITEHYQSLKPHTSDLIQLGQYGFHDLVSNAVLKGLSNKKGVQFAENIGLLKVEKAFPKGAETVRLHFWHDSIQELFAGFYMVSKYPIILEDLSSIQKIFELSYVITFISGLAPAIGAKISEHIVQLANKDENIKMYRKTVDYEQHHIIKTLHSLLVDCYQEAEKSKMTMSHSYCLSDVYLRSDYESDFNTTKRLMKGKGIKSLYLRWIPNDDDGISNSFLTEFLRSNPQLETLYVKGKEGDRTFDAADIFNISEKRALLLDNVTITADSLGDINTGIQLETLGLWNVTFQNSSQSPSSSMKDLLQSLPRIPNLSTLYISCKTYEDDREELIKMLPELEHLTNIQYGGVSDEEEICDNDTDNRVVKRILESRANTLKRLWLDYIKLDIDSLEPIKNMNCLEKVVLRRVHMEEDPWIKTIKNIENTQRQVSVSLVCTNITETVKSTVQNSDNFILDLDNTLHYENMDKFTFCRVLN